jgi:hypothetical protein
MHSNPSNHTAHWLARSTGVQDGAQRGHARDGDRVGAGGKQGQFRSPGFTKTNLNNYASMGTFEDSSEAGRIALLTPDGSTETFTHARLGQLPW